MKDPGIPEIDEILQRIREEVEKRKSLSDHETDRKSWPATAEPFLAQGYGTKRILDEILWKYGRKYSGIIKKIPIVRKIAEQEYFRLACGKDHRGSAETFRQLNTTAPDFLPTHLDYHAFLRRTRQEGPKGRIKLFIFKAFGFFAWWQAQINRALYQKITNMRYAIDNDNLLLNQKSEALARDIIEGNRSTEQRFEEMEQRMKEILIQIRDHELNILDQKGRLALLLDEMSKRLPQSTQLMAAMLKDDNGMSDSVYAAFEDRFRGTRQDIREKLKVYLPYIEQAGAGIKDFTVLDVGCGRGEWLELLKERSFIARGVDKNKVMVSRCKELGLDATEADVITYLRSQLSNSLGAVTGFHIIEHLQPVTMIALFDESLRVLRSGGIIIFETPNPENLIVGACNFYYDLTHVRPLPPESIEFIAEQRGFTDIKILRLHKLEEPDYVGRKFVDNALSRLSMEQDYSILARKP